MIKLPWAPVFGGISVLALSSLLIGQRPVPPVPADHEFGVAHPECDYFGPQREKFRHQGLNRIGDRTPTLNALSTTTGQVTRMIGAVPGGSRTRTFEENHQAGSIDSYIFADFKKNAVTPADRTTDWEFIRRVTLDLTGRIPTADRVLEFVNNTASDKRAKLIDELLEKPEWVDKWTMFFGDLYHATQNRPSTALQRYPEGRNAFYKYIYDSLAANKPYNQMATEMIASQGTNSHEDGASNFLLNGWMTGGPGQDTSDLTAVAVFDTFLGMAHLNCVMCHNGRGHVDTLSLWGTGITRYQAWQLSAHYAKAGNFVRTQIPDSNPQTFYWSVADNTRATDYTLNTATGNRPPRVAPAGCKSGQPCYYVTPKYILNDDAPKPGEDYRAALARNATNDFQFARATVNYLWAYFFGRGLVDPPDSFDPARLDPDNPPPAPWTLQPSNPALLNALARHFIEGGYNLKSAMREIANSGTYQLSSRYNGQWRIEWDKYFARKFVRRLWGEEIHDAVAQSSGVLPSYNYPNFSDRGFGRITWALQFPDIQSPGDGNTNALLDSFIRGNRDEQARKSEGSVLQALNLMNNPFIVNRTRATGTGASQLIAQNLNKNNTDLIKTLFLNILSRYPTPEELAKAEEAIPAANGNLRNTAVSDLVWSLYNKMDFIFNY